VEGWKKPVAPLDAAAHVEGGTMRGGRTDDEGAAAAVCNETQPCPFWPASPLQWLVGRVVLRHQELGAVHIVIAIALLCWFRHARSSGMEL